MGSRCLVNIEGGLGKHVMFTSIIPELKKHYEQVYVVSAYYDVLQACSVVDEAFQFGQPNLYQDICLDDDVDILWKEPYNNADFIRKRIHLFDAWMQEFRLPELETLAMDLTPNVDRAMDIYPTLKVDIDKALNDTNGDFIVVQFCGGQSPLDPNMMQHQYNPAQEPIKRNYQMGQELINLLHEAYPNTAILHYALKNEPSYQFTTKPEMPYLAWHELVKHAKKVVTTDSSLQHLSAGVAKDVTVIWGETRPEHFGYNCCKNICAQHVRNTQPYFKPLGASPAIVKFPTPQEVMQVVEEAGKVVEEAAGKVVEEAGKVVEAC